jgi:hypothetical protein
MYLNSRQLSKYQAIGYSDVHLMLKNTCKEFADKELVPIAHKIDKMHYFPKDHIKKMGDLGLMGMEGSIYFDVLLEVNLVSINDPVV